MGQTSAALGQGSEITHKGKQYKLAPWTFEIQGLFEQYLERQAIEKARRLGRSLPEDEAEKIMDGVMRDINLGIYSFGTKEVAKALDSPRHLKYITWLQMKQKDGSVTHELVNEIYDESRNLLIQAINMANADPNLQAPKTQESEDSGALKGMAV